MEKAFYRTRTLECRLKHTFILKQIQSNIPTSEQMLLSLTFLKRVLIICVLDSIIWVLDFCLLDF